MVYRSAHLFKPFTLLVGSWFLVLLVTVSSSANAAKPLPIKRLLQWPKYGSVTISPDGRYLAVQQNIGGDYQVKYIDISGGKKPKGHDTQHQASDVYSEWVNHDTIVLIQRIPPYGRRIVSYNLTTDQSQILLSTNAVGELNYIGASEDGKYLYISGTDFNEDFNINKDNSVYKLALSDGELSLVVNNDLEIDQWFTDRQAKYWVGYKYDDKVNYIYAYHAKSEKTVKIYQQGLLKHPDFTPLAIDSGNNKMLALTSVDSNTDGIYQYDLATGKELGKVYEDPDFDLSENTLLSHNESQLLGIHYDQAKGESVYFEPQLKKVAKKLAAQFTEDTVNIVDTTTDYKRLVLFVYGDRNPGEYYLYDTAADKLDFIGENMQHLAKDELTKVEPIQFKSRDGKNIHGYLALPKTAAKTNKMPLVVFPHGGPYSRDTWVFDSYLQLLASRGYAVLQVNFRSSTGFGLAHYRGGVKQYGTTPIDDLVDGIKWSLGQYPLDKDKVCVFGASYGGFATLSALTHEPQLFKCGISMAGFADLEKLLKDDKDKDFYDFEVNYMGDPKTQKAMLQKNSPLYQLDKVNAPVLIIHGKLDRRIKFSHARQVEKALKKHNKVYETYYVRDEGHTFYKRRNRLKLFKTIFAFLDKHIGRKIQ